MFGVNAIPNFYIQWNTKLAIGVIYNKVNLRGMFSWKCDLSNFFFAICGSWLVDKYIFKDNDIYIIGRSEIPASYSL